ncbi:hypothetical protein ElyMa_004329100 [Elysia marginata]|uniref:Uncharacterized protein n=1 Tax=Elysia marginata TaxID=1093978 RepID=A0AAV4H004_9GAST|nr:hypothetical protein ElyMa_004329100 [Elysia marginata]
MESELKKTDALKTKTSEDLTTAESLIDARLQKFSLEQRRVLTNLREELQQQNQALIADISRLLEGFASLVGRVVKGELEKALVSFSPSASGTSSSSKPANSSQSPQTATASDQASSRTWSKVHVEQSLTSDDADSAQMTVEDLIRQAGEKAAKKKKKRGKKKQKKAVNPKESTKSPPCKTQSSNGRVASEKPTFSSLIKDYKDKNDMDPSVHFFPEDGPASLLVFDITQVAESGKISKSPLYYLQDFPFKVQLSLWFDAEKELKICVTFWGLSPDPYTLQRVFTISGEIKNKNSSAFSSLFSQKSPPFNLQKPWSQNLDLPLVLKTKRGSYSELKLDTLKMRNFILENRNSISIRWNVESSEV